MREIKGYALSRDYELLWRLGQEQSVVCVVDYNACRDVAQTNFLETRGGLIGNVCVRGCSYIYAFTKAQFLAQCEEYHCEFIVPHHESAVLLEADNTDDLAPLLGTVGIPALAPSDCSLCGDSGVVQRHPFILACSCPAGQRRQREVARDSLVAGPEGEI